MRAFTDIFIKHPVLAAVVNLVIVLVGIRALTTLPVQQFPSIESSSVIITTVYTGASAETVRGFLTTPIERAVSSIGGVDYVESQSRAGISTVTVRLKLNHNSTAALAEVTARLQQVRSEFAGRSGAAGRGHSARRPSVWHLLPELHFDPTRRPGADGLAVANAAATVVDSAGRAARDCRRRPPAGDARVDRS